MFLLSFWPLSNLLLRKNQNRFRKGRSTASQDSDRVFMTYRGGNAKTQQRADSIPRGRKEGVRLDNLTSYF